jgi:hypothetical protein
MIEFCVIALVYCTLITLVLISSLCLRYEDYELCSIYVDGNAATTWIMFCASLVGVIFVTMGMFYWLFYPKKKKRSDPLEYDRENLL